MNVLESLKIVRRSGSTGFTVAEFDSVGVKDVSNRYYTPWASVHVGIAASSVNAFVWGCVEGVWQIGATLEYHTVAGGSGATVMPVVCPQHVAIASGVSQLTAAIDLTVTAPAGQFGTMIASPTEIRRGDIVGLLFAGTLTGLVGSVTMQFKRIG